MKVANTCGAGYVRAIAIQRGHKSQILRKSANLILSGQSYGSTGTSNHSLTIVQIQQQTPRFAPDVGHLQRSTKAARPLYQSWVMLLLVSALHHPRKYLRGSLTYCQSVTTLSMRSSWAATMSHARGSSALNRAAGNRAVVDPWVDNHGDRLCSVFSTLATPICSSSAEN